MFVIRMVTIEELEEQIEKERKIAIERDRRRNIAIESQMDMKRLGEKKKRLMRELKEMRNPRYASSVRGIKSVTKSGGGIFGTVLKNAWNRIPEPHTERKPVKRKPVKRKPVKRKPVKRKPVKRKPVKRKKKK